MIGFWFFASVVAVLIFLGCFMLMKVRIADVRANAISRQADQQMVSNEAMTVMNMNKRTEQARYEYGTKQAEFGLRVLALVEQGVWNGDLEEIKQACIRQLDGVPPPPHAPTMVIPKAKMPDLSGRHGRYGPDGYTPYIEDDYETFRTTGNQYERRRI